MTYSREADCSRHPCNNEGPKSIVHLAFNCQGCWQTQRFYWNLRENSESLRFELKHKEGERSQDSSVDLMLPEQGHPQLNSSTSGETGKIRKGCREVNGDIWEQNQEESLLNWWRREGVHALSLQTEHWYNFTLTGWLKVRFGCQGVWSYLIMLLLKGQLGNFPAINDAPLVFNIYIVSS